MVPSMGLYVPIISLIKPYKRNQGPTVRIQERGRHLYVGFMATTFDKGLRFRGIGCRV